MKKRILALLVTVCLFIGSFGGIVYGDDSDNTLTVFHINDVHGYAVETTTTIGYAKLAGYVDEYRANDPNTLFLEAGDTFQGNVYASFDKGESLVNILSTVGFDAMTAGNSEFMLGPDDLTRCANLLDYPVLTANMYMKDTDDLVDGLEAYTTITTVSGVTVGIVGVTTPDSLASNQDKYDYVDAVESAKAVAANHRDEVDVLIALVHLGVNVNTAVQISSTELAETCTDFDAIIDGHSHDEYFEVVNGTPIVQTGSYGNNLGKLTLTLDESNTVTGVNETLLTYSDFVDQTPKADTLEATEQMLEKYEADMGTVVGSTLVYLNAERDSIRTSETNMGNLFTDSMLEYTGADIAVAISGGIGGEVGPGDITKGDVMAMARIESVVVTIDMKGSDIIAMLNNSVSSYPASAGGFLQVSGIQFKFDPELNENRVFAASVNGTPIDQDATYTVACFEGAVSTLPNSGDSPISIIETFATTYDVLLWYFEKYSTVNPQIEGRITAVGSAANDKFTDIDANDWYYDYVSRAYDSELVIGTSDTTYEPLATMTRGMFATVIYRIAESQGADITSIIVTPEFPGAFSDVFEDDYYFTAVNWAYHNGIVDGTGYACFSPDSPITREQAATILGRMINTEDEITKAEFTDSDAISDWASEYVDLLAYNGLIQGYEDGYFRPQKELNRAEASKILSIFATDFEVSTQ